MASFLQRIFRRPDYRSDVTQFIETMKVEHPDLEAQQRAGRAIWWDKHLDREAIADWQEARVPQKPYVYGDAPRQRR
ncbi:MAG: hypothetical protein JWP65_1725 [Ramlibacter sp.]|jgi:hypothetical protein|uniref:DUF3460 family protein n=1 Tax=Ramlibacter sp. TaxID=1917967 RepID=UPI00263773FD|nr:DUF3460 family protein [Ramlibacter sp.]MDB5751304.1 hypothetical protein [Ramlibacter sp.]